MMMIFESGKLAPSPFWPSAVRDGALLEYGKDGGFYVAVYLHGMTAQEESALRKSRIRARYIREEECFLLLIQVYGGLIFELPFAPRKYRDRSVSVEQTGLVQFLFIDSSSGILRGVRMATPPQLAWRALAESISLPASRNYDAWLEKLMQDETETLWGFGVEGGSFGEVPSK